MNTVHLANVGIPMINRTVPPALLQLLEISNNQIPISLGFKDGNPTYAILVPGKYDTIVVTDTGEGGLVATTRYDITLDNATVENIFNTVMDSVRVLNDRNGRRGASVLGSLPEEWIKVGVYLNLIEETTTTAVTYKFKS
jgi:hypothetical protein